MTGLAHPGPPYPEHVKLSLGVISLSVESPQGTRRNDWHYRTLQKFTYRSSEKMSTSFTTYMLSKPLGMFSYKSQSKSIEGFILKDFMVALSIAVFTRGNASLIATLRNMFLPGNRDLAFKYSFYLSNTTVISKYFWNLSFILFFRST